MPLCPVLHTSQLSSHRRGHVCLPFHATLARASSPFLSCCRKFQLCPPVSHLCPPNACCSTPQPGGNTGLHDPENWGPPYSFSEAIEIEATNKTELKPSLTWFNLVSRFSSPPAYLITDPFISFPAGKFEVQITHPGGCYYSLLWAATHLLVRAALRRSLYVGR